LREVETAAPLAASLNAGEPVEINHTPSFVDGIGVHFVFPEMFSLACQLLDGSLVTSLDGVVSAIKIMAERNHVIAEGAGAAPVERSWQSVTMSSLREQGPPR
jgi:threonine dehydratase